MHDEHSDLSDLTQGGSESMLGKIKNRVGGWENFHQQMAADIKALAAESFILLTSETDITAHADYLAEHNIDPATVHRYLADDYHVQISTSGRLSTVSTPESHQKWVEKERQRCKEILDLVEGYIELTASTTQGSPAELATRLQYWLKHGIEHDDNYHDPFCDEVAHFTLRMLALRKAVEANDPTTDLLVQFDEWIKGRWFPWLKPPFEDEEVLYFIQERYTFTKIVFRELEHPTNDILKKIYRNIPL